MPTPNSHLPRLSRSAIRRALSGLQQQPVGHSPENCCQQQFGATDYQPTSPGRAPATRRAPDITDISGEPPAPSDAPVPHPPDFPTDRGSAVHDYVRDADVQIDARAPARRQMH